MLRSRLARLPLLLCLLLLCVPALADVTVEVTPDRADALYRCGQSAVFTVRVLRDGVPVTDAPVHATATLDGGLGVGEGDLVTADGAARYESTLADPGILRVSVTYNDGGKVVTGLGGAAFEPERIEPGAPEPADFDEFWTAQKALLAEVPIDAQLTEMPDLSDGARTIYKLTLANVDGARVRGWLAVPTSAGPHPAVLTVPWAGVYPTPLGLTDWSRQGFLAMAISAHDYEVDRPQAEFDQLNAGGLADYPHQGRESRETCYFRKVFLGCVRAVDYLVSREDWDGAHLIVTGSSQGGGLSLVTAGLDPRITGLAANVPALCDHLGYKAQRQQGWPWLVQPGVAEQEEAAGYFDAVHFAKRAHCPAIVGVGYVDTVCSPSSVYAAYNVLPGVKLIVATPSMGHSQSPEYSALLSTWLPAQAGIQP